MDIQMLSTIAGLISLGLTLCVSIFGGYYLVKSGIGKKTREAQESTINAMREEISVLRGRVDDVKRENNRLDNIINTICVALEKKGIIITISGEMITIEVEDGKKSTTIRIDEAHR